MRIGAGRATTLVLIGMAGQEVGASIAVLLFPQAGPIGMVTLRLVFSALVLLAVARPSIRGHSRSQWRGVLFFGLSLVLMNGLFYLAIARLDLGVAVTIEVLGPLTLAVIAARRRAAWLWAGLALVGVAILGGGVLGEGGWSRLDPVGVLCAVGAAACWALYILGSARVGRDFDGIDGLALAMSVGALVALPFGLATTGTVLLRWDVLGLGFAIAMLSSALPYALELIALRRLSETTFAILMSLGPATASTAGFLVLGQRLGVLELIGIALVIVASIGAVRMQARVDARDAAAMSRDVTVDADPPIIAPGAP